MKLAKCSMFMAFYAALSAAACDTADGEIDAAAEALDLADADTIAEGGKGPQKPKVVGYETLDVTIPGSLHAQGLPVPAKLVRPKWSQPVGKQPAVLVLHGSGGLLKMPKSESDDPCGPDMEPQYADWSQKLAERGYVVLLPSSYSARGFCDYHKDVARIPGDFDEKQERNIARLYDYDAAARWLCARGEVDCDRMGLLGFSNGATLVMLALHWQIERIPERLRELYADAIDFDVPDMAPGRPTFRVGVAYYPGCGFDDLVSKSTDAKTAVQDKFFPTSPLFIEHGTEDDLIVDCTEDWGPGRREIQSAQVAKSLEAADPYSITVYEGAHHSFDNTSGSGTKGSPGSAADVAARDAAEAATMKNLAAHLK